MNLTQKKDILIELFNISIGKSASILSEITNRKIILKVPNLKIIDLKNETLILENYLPEEVQGSTLISSLYFEDELRGRACLIFPADKTKQFVNLCLNQDNDNFYDLDSTCVDLDFTDIDFDIIKEIGNILLNAIIGEFANFLKTTLDYTLSEVKIFRREEFENHIKFEDYSHILVLYINFKIDDSEIVAAIIINLSLTSLSQLFHKIETIEDEFFG